MNYRSIELNLKVGCPISCNYCPQDKFLNSDYGNKRKLSNDDFKIILNNATSSENMIEVFFAGFSEPLSCDNWFELLNICELNYLVVRFVLFTTGYKISEDNIKLLSNFKKIKINFHVGKKVNMINFDENIWNKLHLIKEFLPNVVFLEVGRELEEFKTINNLLDQYGLNYQFQKIINRAGNLKTEEFVNLEYPVTCEKMNEKKRPVVLPDGTVLACSNDYGCEMKIGNLLHQTWDELDFKKIIDLQKNCKSGLPCFRSCHLAKKDYIKIFS